MSLYMQNAIQFLKEQKEQFAKNDQCRELPPHLIVENKSGPAAIVIAPSLDKDLALKAAAMCSIGFSPVSMTIAFDALMSNAEESDEKQDCIICHSIDKEVSRNVQQGGHADRQRYTPEGTEKWYFERGAYRLKFAVQRL